MPTKPCPEGMTRNAATKECREKKKPGRAAKQPCPEGMTRNAATKECREKKPSGRRPKAVASPNVGSGLSKFRVHKVLWDARLKLRTFDYQGKPLGKLPIPSGDLAHVRYDRVEVYPYLRQARAIAKNMFARKENNVRGVLNMVYYVPKKDVFVVVLRARSELEPKIIKNNAYYGVEFTINPNVDQHPIVMDKAAIVLSRNSDLKDEALSEELYRNLLVEHPSAVQLVK